MKKVIAILFVVLLVATFLSGCTNNPPAATNAPTAAAATDTPAPAATDTPAPEVTDAATPAAT